jgi:hypothetical protein
VGWAGLTVARELTTHLLSVQTTPLYAAATQHRFLSLSEKSILACVLKYDDISACQFVTFLDR